jgi:lambda family phage tail tape measure protein
MSMDALLKIRAQVDGANKIVELNRGLRSVEGAAKGVTGAMRGLSGASAGLSGALGALAPLASVAGLVGLAKGALDAGDKLYDMAQKTGVSVESLARFKKAAATSGTDIDAVAKSLNKLNKGMYEAATTGKGKAADALKTLGISATDASGRLKKADAVMLEIANEFSKMEGGAKKSGLAMALFGAKTGADMIPMLNMGGAAIDKLSVKMTTAFAEKADAYSDKLAMLSGKVGALGADLLIALLPALDAVTSAVTAGVGAFNSLPGPVKGLAVSAAMLAIAWGPLSGLIAGASTLFIAGAAAVGTLRVQIALAAMEEIPALSAAIMAIPGWGWALAGVVALGALGTALYTNNTDFRNWVDNVASIVANDFKAAMADIAKAAKDAFKAAVDAGNWCNKKMKEIANSIPQGFSSGFSRMVQSAQQKFAQMQAIVMGWWNRIPAPVRGLLSKGASAVGDALNVVPGVYAAKVYLGALGKGPVAKQSGNGNGNGNGNGGGGGDIPGLTGGSGGTGKKTGADKAAAEAKRLAEEQAKQLLASQKALAISQAELTVTQTTNALEKAAAEYALQKLRIEQDFAVKLADTKQLKDGQVKQEIISNIEAAKRNELEKARLGYLEQQTKELLRQAGIDNPDFGKKPTGVDPKDTYKYKPSPGTGLQGEDRKKIDEEYNKIKERLNDLMNPANQIIGAANAIGDAFATSFEGMISGAMTAKQALASFFKDLASYFTKMATQMIADALRMAAIKILTNILSSVLGGFGGGGGGTDLGKNFNSAGAGDTGISWGAAVNYKRNALGNVYGANGIVPFADGGIVNQPTLFKFAQGGAMQNGLMGEAGPESIMPLKRGRDGKLGVIASGGGGTTNISINVDARGTKAEGDQGKSGALARDLAAVVDQRLVYHKRPGGILA